MSDPAISLVPSKTDAEKAAGYRAELMPLFDQLCVVLNRAKADGLIINFNVGADQYGRIKLQATDVLKPL